MNICFFNLTEESGSGGATVGGMQRASHLLAQELRRRGHHVEFYYSKPSLISPSIIPPFLVSLVRHSASVRFREFLKEHKIDVAAWQWGVFAVSFSVKNLPCKLITMWHNTPSYATDANFAINRLRIRLRIIQRLFRSAPISFLIRKWYTFSHNHFFFSYAVRHSDKFVLLSERFFPDFPLVKKFPEKICANPNIAPFGKQSVSFDKKKKELLWVGRVAFAQKRPDYLLQIWRKLQDHFPDWKLRFVGDGDYLPELKSLAEELGVQRVSFEGFQDPATYYRSAPIFCMTSANEGFGLVIVEAQAYGCVPVAFDSFGAVHDIIKDGVNGFLVPPFDLDIYAEKLAEIMSSPELRERLGSAAQKSIAKFSPEAVGDKWEKLLKEVVGSNQ